MTELVFEFLTNWQFILISAAFLLVLFFILMQSDKKTKNTQRKKKDMSGITKPAATCKTKKEEPGRILVPDSTYEILKREKYEKNTH